MLLSKYAFFYMVAQKYERKDFLQTLRSLLSFKLCLVCYVYIQFLKLFEKNIIIITLTGQTLLVRAENGFSTFHDVWMWKPFIPAQSHLGELSSAKFKCPCQDHELSWHIISVIAGIRWLWLFLYGPSWNRFFLMTSNEKKGLFKLYYEYVYII